MTATVKSFSVLFGEARFPLSLRVGVFESDGVEGGTFTVGCERPDFCDGKSRRRYYFEVADVVRIDISYSLIERESF